METPCWGPFQTGPHIVGKAFAYDEVTDAVETIVDTYVTERRNSERFLDTYRRVGLGPFKEALYGVA